MHPFPPNLLIHLGRRMNEVRQVLGLPPLPQDGDVRFADALDSMGLVEFVALLADDCGVPSDVIEEVVGRRFTTLADLALAMHNASLSPTGTPAAGTSAEVVVSRPQQPIRFWLTGISCYLPERVQLAAELDALLGRPSGWLEAHAGIRQRHLWASEDVVEAAGRIAAQSLDRAGLRPGQVGALLITSEAPPLLTGLAAALHHRLGLGQDTPALEIGGACTGFLAALWTAQRLIASEEIVLVLAVEAPSRWLTVRPGEAGEAAALFGDGVAACVVCAKPTGAEAVPFRDVRVGADGSGSQLLQARWAANAGIEIAMDGPALATRAVRTMAGAVETLARQQGLEPSQLEAIVAHGGNGRLPGLLARQLGLDEARIWSEVAHTGNLGSVSLPAAWTAHGPARGTTVWVAVGAGLVWAAALSGLGLGPIAERLVSG